MAAGIDLATKNVTGMFVEAGHHLCSNQARVPDVLYYYNPAYWNKLDGMPYSPGDNFLEPPQNIMINGIPDAFSERFADGCTPWKTQPPSTQPFDFGKILIVGNGQCASTCAVFVTIMQELHGVKVANFGAAKNSHSGMASGAVLNWSLLDSEVKVSVIHTETNTVDDSGAFLRLRALRTARGQARTSLSMPSSLITGGKRRSDNTC